jgi:hypothetical protein
VLVSVVCENDKFVGILGGELSVVEVGPSSLPPEEQLGNIIKKKTKKTFIIFANRNFINFFILVLKVS